MIRPPSELPDPTALLADFLPLVWFWHFRQVWKLDTAQLQLLPAGPWGMKAWSKTCFPVTWIRIGFCLTARCAGMAQHHLTWLSS